MFELNTFHYLFIVLWTISSVCAYAEFLYYWQLKEYRLDRMSDFLRSVQGQQYIVSYSVLYRMILASIFLFVPFNNWLTIVLVLVLFGLDAVVMLYRLVWRKLRLPRRTKKIFVLLTLALLFDAFLLLDKETWDAGFMVFALRPLIMGVIVLIFEIPTKEIKHAIIYLATRKMRKFPNLTVIGITGSYGKSTVKEMLYYVLSEKYTVWKTPKNTNTDIGIAQLILKSQLRDVDVMVVEMGAYKIGEIKAICNIVKPKIGILTAINEQHVSLFGSIKHTQKAKYELLQSIPKDGVAVVNSDNEYIREHLNTLPASVVSFGWDGQYEPTCRIVDVHETLSGTMTTFIMNNDKTFEVHVPLIGAHHAMNVAPVLLVAQSLDLPVENAVERFKTLPQPGRGLTLLQFGKSVVIDDSYNSNPDGFRAALNVLSRFPGNMRRVVVTRGMIELGDQSDRVHETIAGEIAFVADELILVTKDHETPMREGSLSEKYHLDFVLKDNPDKLREYLLSFRDTESVILFENRLPGDAYRAVIEKCTPFISQT